jgi:hypothetical protein
MMDNFIMIQCGSLIDNTLGVKFGLATLTAAAMGQVVSDVSGVLFGGSVERLLSPYFKAPQLSSVQKKLPIVHRLRLAGAVGGVITGCMLGALSLYFVIDEDSSRPFDQLAQLNGIITDMMEDVPGASTCKFYVRNANHTVSSDDSHHHSGKVIVTPLDDTSTLSEKAQACVANMQVLFCDNSLYVPVMMKDGDFLGVMELSGHELTLRDEKAARRLARNVGIFMSHVKNAVDED